MKTVYPDYYPQFRCIADRCVHNCCIGWEIDIDPVTLRRYLLMDGPLGERLRQSIAFDADGAHFKLDAQKRCLMLNQNGLCDLITEAGDGALCGICRDHPRFRNRLRGVEEIGLGLCCEAACKLILDGKQRPQLIMVDDGRSKAAPTEPEQRYITRREEMLDLIWADGMDPNSAMKSLLRDYYGCPEHLPFTPKQWARTFLLLEHMEASWADRLNQLRERPPWFDDIPPKDALKARHLLTYFIYRYAIQGWKRRRKRYNSAIAFCVLSVHMIFALSEGPEDLYETARQYSAEIEYSDINVKKLLEKFDRYAEAHL